MHDCRWVEHEWLLAEFAWKESFICHSWLREESLDSQIRYSSRSQELQIASPRIPPRAA